MMAAAVVKKTRLFWFLCLVFIIIEIDQCHGNVIKLGSKNKNINKNKIRVGCLIVTECFFFFYLISLFSLYSCPTFSKDKT